ncbi:L,D-transpeptidase family protein [Kitasatospora sp. NPDC058218]|uniref:L,D-transpeptidase family protein n=1 Tax=Kitasatospora sp. NPDC058218 TaxID=3346385 RepID=UPI0036DDCFFA
MSGSHRATTYPPYESMHEPVYEGPQQSYGVYEQPSHQGWDASAPAGTHPNQPFHDGYPQQEHADPRGHGHQGHQDHYAPQDQQGHQDLYAPQGYQDGYVPQARQGHQDLYVPQARPGAEGYDAYDRPFQPHPAEPAPPLAAAQARPPVQAPAADPVAAPAVGPRTAARGHRRKPKKKRGGKAVTAGTALLLAAAAGWYTVGQDAGNPGATSAGGPGPEGVSAPDQPSPAAAAPAAQAANDRHTEAPAADRSEARPDGSVAAIPGLGAAFTAQIPAGTTQVVLASGQDKDANRTAVTLWTRTAEGRWLAGETWQGHNANKGWTTDHNEGDLRSPIGVFSLTDAGGRKADPGSRLPYDKDADFVVSGRGFAGEQLAGSFDYVVAINYNRVPGNSPLDPRRPSGSTKGGGIWIHVDHGGPTHGCISVPEDKMAQLIRTLDPAAHPVIVMGDAASLAA